MSLCDRGTKRGALGSIRQKTISEGGEDHRGCRHLSESRGPRAREWKLRFKIPLS
jgi:hypothetical protein